VSACDMVPRAGHTRGDSGRVSQIAPFNHRDMAKWEGARAVAGAPPPVGSSGSSGSSINHNHMGVSSLDGRPRGGGGFSGMG
jgi:hypothetical protein